MQKSFLSLAMAASFVFAAGNAHADYLTFSGVDNNGNAAAALSATPNSTAAETAFKSNLSGVGTENFETRSGGAPMVLDFGAAGTATLIGAGSVGSNGVGGTNGSGRYSVPGGTRYWETNAGDANTLQIQFSQEIAAFGFYATDVGDFGGTLSLEFLDDTNTLIKTLSVQTSPQAVADGSVLYFGVIAGNDSELFKTVRFVSTVGSGDAFGFDSFTIGAREQVAAVPEPASFALMGLGLLGLAASRRKGAKR